MLDKLLDKVFDFAVSPRGIVTLLSALGGAADRRRETPPTGGGVAYGMAGPRRLQQVRDLGRYSDVMRFDEGGPTISVDTPSPLLYGLAQGPYGPLLAYDIGPKMGPRFSAPTPDTQRETAPTQGYVTGQEGPGMGMGPQEEAALDAAIASGAHGKSMTALNQTLTNLVNKSTPMTLTKGLANLLSPLTASLTGTSEQAVALADQLGVTPQQAQSMITTLGLEGVPVTGPATGIPDASLTGGSSIGIDAFGPGGPGGDVGGDVGGVGGIGDVGPGSGGESPWAEGGYVTQYAQGGSVFTMQDGGFVLPKDAVKGAGGPQGIAQLLPQARMIGGPPDPTGKRDLTPAKIVGPNGVTPARVSRGEAYIPPEGVHEAGGAKALYALMHKLERNA